ERADEDRGDDGHDAAEDQIRGKEREGRDDRHAPRGGLGRGGAGGQGARAAKSPPPMGVLNVAAMPAPPPAATSVASCQREARARRPVDDAKAAPIWMMGPSRPTEPPLPIEMAEAKDLTAATIGRMTPFL